MYNYFFENIPICEMFCLKVIHIFLCFLYILPSLKQKKTVLVNGQFPQ